MAFVVDVETRIHVNSVAGTASCCYVASLNIAFDMGVNFLQAVSQDNVFITHGHIDHIQAIAAHAAERSLIGMSPAVYYVPSHLVLHVEQIMASFSAMQESPIPAKIVGIEAGASIQVSSKVIVKAFPTVHRVASLGYVAYALSKSLKSEYVGLPGRELGALRKQNVEIENVVLTPVVAYTGDTTIDFFDKEDVANDFMRANVLVTECTYADDGTDEGKATSRGHIHLGQIARRFNRFQNKALVLTHFSARYSFRQICETVAARLPSDKDRPTVFVAYGEFVARLHDEKAVAEL
ncbi:unnamed protein product [Aphanomyces euteiches]|nr:hypothetical protein Ae201684P_000501 [Aphanomyces euteiches]KAH9154735.1 hypothetical protein AeRB84_003217 [Aphanomyces euteiches]